MNAVSVNQFSTLRWSLFQDVLNYAKHGYDSIGLCRCKVGDFGESETIDLIHEMKLDVSSLHWVGGFTGCTGSSFEDTVTDAKEAIRLAAAVNAGCLIVHPGSRNSHTWGHAERLLSNALDELIPYALDYEVTLALEPMTGSTSRNWTIFDLPRTIEFTSQYASYELGLVLDLYHVGLSQKVVDDLPKFIERVKLVQIADQKSELASEENRCCLGEGNIPVEDWLRLLASAGYRGPFELELHGNDMKEVNYSNLLEESHQYISGCIARSRKSSVTSNRTSH